VSDQNRDVRPQLSAGLIAELADLLDLPTTADWIDLGGSSTTNLRVIDSRLGAVVVRIHRRSVTRERLTAEQAARRALARAGLPTVPPIADASGSTVHALASGSLVELEPFVSSTAQMKTPRLLVAGFALLARVHDALAAASLPSAAETIPWSNHIATSAAVGATERGAERMRSWGRHDLTIFADRVVEHVETVVNLETKLPEVRRQVVHGDYWDNNVLFDGNRVAAILDFGFMAKRVRLDDLALPIWFYLLEPGHGLPTPDDMRLVCTMIDSYDSASDAPLSESERLALPLAIARQPAWSVGGWVQALDEPSAIDHALEAAREFRFAEAVLSEIDVWQRLLVGQQGIRS
jgi:homoserine kinase type II